MTLQLCGLSERVPDLYRELNGRVIDTMPLLVSGKDEKGNIVDVPRTPVSFAYVLERRETASEDVREAWQKNYFFTGDLVATGTMGDVISVWDSPLLRSLTSESKLDNGALIISPTQWEELKSQKEGSLYLTAEEAAQAHQQGYIQRGGEWVPTNKTVARVWEHLSRGRALGLYTQIVPEVLPASQSIMNVYFDASARQKTTGRAWVANRVGYYSVAGGNDILYNGNGRLVGVAAEPHVAREKMLEARVTAALDAGQEFEFKGRLYVPVADSVASRLRR